MIVYRNTDTDVPFFWEDDRQPEGRWHGAGEGPAQYTATSPDAAWAEFLRHQGITDPTDLPGIDRREEILAKIRHQQERRGDEAEKAGHKSRPVPQRQRQQVGGETLHADNLVLHVLE